MKTYWIQNKFQVNIIVKFPDKFPFSRGRYFDRFNSDFFRTLGNIKPLAEVSCRKHHLSETLNFDVRVLFLDHLFFKPITV